MKTVCKKLLSLMLVAILLVSAVPFQASATEGKLTVTYYCDGNVVGTYEEDYTSGTNVSKETIVAHVPEGYEYSDWQFTTGPSVNADTHTPSTNAPAYNCIVTAVPASNPDPITYDVTLKAYYGETLLDTVTCNALTAGTTINVSEKISVDGYYISSVEGGSNTISVVGNATYRVEMAPNAVENPTGNEGTPNGSSTAGKTITVNFLLSGDDTIQKTVTATIGSKISGVPSASDVLNYYAKEYGSSANKQFKYWRMQDGTTFDPSTTNIPANTYSGGETLNLYAVVTDVNTYSVEFQRYTNNGWEYVTSVAVFANSTVSKPTNDFSYTYNGVSFDIVGWEIGETDVAFSFDSTKVTEDIVVRPRYRGTVTLTAQEPPTIEGSSWKSNYVTLEIGEPIGKLSNPGARSTYAFDGWVSTDGTIVICNSYCNSTLEYYPNLYGTTFYVKWAGAITVNLHIYTAGNTTTATKIVPYYVAPATGPFDLSAINMYSIYPAYANYDDEGDTNYGWYTSEEWKNFCANRAAHAAFVYTNIEANGLTDFHIMLIDNGNNTTYNTNTSTLDSSNPTTGDQIFMAVAVLAISATALAAIFFYNKKRQACK